MGPAAAAITTAAITITVMEPAAAAITTAAITITVMGPAAAQAVAIITVMAAATAILTVMAAATITAAAVTAATAANWNTKAREAGRMDRRTPAVPMKSMIIRSDMDIRRPDTIMIRRKTRTSITLTLPDA